MLNLKPQGKRSGNLNDRWVLTQSSATFAGRPARKHKAAPPHVYITLNWCLLTLSSAQHLFFAAHGAAGGMANGGAAPPPLIRNEAEVGPDALNTLKPSQLTYRTGRLAPSTLCTLWHAELDTPTAYCTAEGSHG